MLHLIPPPLHRFAFRLAHGLRKRWWRLRKPSLQGCRVLALDRDDRVLLVRHSYGSGKWMPPGGGVGRGEDVVAAALRELREETGCAIDDACEVTIVVEPLHGAANTVHIIAGCTADCPVVDRREVVDAGFFALDALPEFMPPQLREQLPAWVRAAKAARRVATAAQLHSPPATTG